MTALLRLTLLTSALMALIGTGAARADLRACNQTNDTISVAIGYSDSGTWTSEGWWTMTAGDCKNMVTGDLKNRFYYWRATIDGQPLPTGDFYFCTSAKVFTIAGDTECEERGYERVAFSQVDTGDAKSYTIEVSGGASISDNGDDLDDLRTLVQGDWYAKVDPEFTAIISGKELTFFNGGEQLETIKFEIAMTCRASEGDGPVMLIEPPVPGGAEDCWLLVNSSQNSFEIYVYETDEGGVFLRQN